jgi:hypothetical protein
MITDDRHLRSMRVRWRIRRVLLILTLHTSARPGRLTTFDWRLLSAGRPYRNVRGWLLLIAGAAGILGAEEAVTGELWPWITLGVAVLLTLAVATVQRGG